MDSKKFRIAVLVDSSSGWGRRLIRGIANYGLKHGNWQLLVEERGSREAMHLPPGWEGDGIIARVNNPSLYHELASTGKPVVNVSGIRVEGVELPTVTTDYEATATVALDHFTERGFHHLAYCGLEDQPHEQRHCQTFVDVSKARDLPCAVFHSSGHPSGSDWERERAELATWLQGLPKPVGILAWGTRRGRDLLNICNEFDLSVPEEIAVLAGDDDELLCEVCYPPMSGIITPAEQIGHEAAAILDQMFHGETPRQHTTLLPPEGVDCRLSTDTLAVSDPALVAAIRFIRERIRSPIQVADVAEEAGVSRRALERKFASVVGHSPAREIQNARLKCAQKLLRETSMSVADAAAASGYGSAEYMIKIFQKHTGLTPRHYRNKIRAL